LKSKCQLQSEHHNKKTTIRLLKCSTMGQTPIVDSNEEKNINREDLNGQGKMWKKNTQRT
jgi:hypothetical protein